MKSTLQLLVLLSSIFGAFPASAEVLPNLPQLVELAPAQIFAPPGFDDNDSAQITIAGEMPNTCYKAAGPATAEVDPIRKTILIRNQVYYYSGCWCLQVTVPYVKTIDVGVLPAGKYDILVERTNGEARKSGALSVAISKNIGPDDYLYALVDDVTIESEGNSHSKRLTLNGTLTSSCMDLSEVKVLDQATNVIQVLPIVSLKTNVECEPVLRKFKTSVELSPSWNGSTLVHVRSLNGQAVNKITQFP